MVTGSVVVLAAAHGPAGPAAISEANAAAAAAGLVAPLLLGAGVAVGLGWRPGLLVAALAAVAVWVVSRRESRLPAPAPATAAGGGRAGAAAGGYWLAWVVLAAVHRGRVLHDVLGRGRAARAGRCQPAAATAGVTAIVGGMFAGRLLGGRLRAAGPARAAAAGRGGGDAGRVRRVLGQHRAGAGGGRAGRRSGSASRCSIPLGAVRAVAASAGRPDRAAGRLSIAAGLASGIAPFALGALADRAGTHAAFLLVPALLLVAAAGVLVSGDVRAARAQA